MSKMIILILFVSFTGFARGANPSKSVVDPSLGVIVEECEVKDAKRHVWIFKQWHLAPSVNTHIENANPPQRENQRAIFQQVEKWVDKSDITTIYAEGCSGEITEHFPKTFNGWDFKTLEDRAKDKNFDEIVTLIPLKLKAKYHDKVKVQCADDESVIQKQNESLSDARGTVGFLTRIEQLKGNPQRVKIYVEKAAEMDHLPKGSSMDRVVKKLNEDLKTEVGLVQLGIDKRNESFAKSIAQGSSESVLVVGGLHAKGLVELLKKKEIDCTVIEPKGYRSEDEKIFNVSERDRK
jgi:hypothetical protein